MARNPSQQSAGRKGSSTRRSHRSASRSSQSAGKRAAGKKAAGKNAGGKPPKLRIIGGEMRGRQVPYHGAAFTRPMKDNIRENLFNILGPSVRGAVSFDLFAGTGALGFESLSRGARSTTMIEQNRRAANFIRDTASQLDVEARVQLLVGDAFKLAPTLLGPPQDDTPWIVFVCPPYALWEENLGELHQILQRVMENAPPGSILVAETEKKFDPGRLPEAEWDLREYGGTRLAFNRPASRCGLRG